MAIEGILGIDLSLTGTGLALISSNEPVALGPPFDNQNIWERDSSYWLTTAHLNKAQGTTFGRWKYIREMVIAAALQASTIIIEGYSFGSHMAHVRSIAELGGIVRYALCELGRTYIEVAPNVLKKFISGRGVGIKKNEMLLETFKRYKISFKSDDVCDAFGLAKIGQALALGTDGLPQFQIDIIEQLKNPQPKKKRSARLPVGVA